MTAARTHSPPIGHCPTANYRLHDASAATMLVRVLAPDCGDVVGSGVEALANDVSILTQAIEARPDIEADIIASVLRGIEQRLRVLAAVAARGVVDEGKVQP